MLEAKEPYTEYARSIVDGQKWFEQHLVEYRQQTATVITDFASVVGSKLIWTDSDHGKINRRKLNAN